MYGYSLKPMGDLTMAGQADSQVRNRALLDVVDALDLFRLWRVLEVFDAPTDGTEADLVAVSRSECDVSARLGWATSRLGGLPSGNPWLGGVTAALVLIALLTAGFAWCAFPMCGRLRLHHRLAEPMTDLLLERKRSYWMFSLWFVDLPFFTIRCVAASGTASPSPPSSRATSSTLAPHSSTCASCSTPPSMIGCGSSLPGAARAAASPRAATAEAAAAEEEATTASLRRALRSATPAWAAAAEEAPWTRCRGRRCAARARSCRR